MAQEDRLPYLGSRWACARVRLYERHLWSFELSDATRTARSAATATVGPYYSGARHSAEWSRKDYAGQRNHRMSHPLLTASILIVVTALASVVLIGCEGHLQQTRGSGGSTAEPSMPAPAPPKKLCCSPPEWIQGTWMSWTDAYRASWIFTSESVTYKYRHFDTDWDWYGQEFPQPCRNQGEEDDVTSCNNWRDSQPSATQYRLQYGRDGSIHLFTRHGENAISYEGEKNFPGCYPRNGTRDYLPAHRGPCRRASQ